MHIRSERHQNPAVDQFPIALTGYCDLSGKFLFKIGDFTS
jgi:hypothetical protein